MVRVEPIDSDRFARAYRLRLRYKDKPRISFTDLTSFVVMTELGIRDVLTGDAHFASVQLGFHPVA
jgi:predicted nucleic acid-binding protein